MINKRLNRMNPRKGTVIDCFCKISVDCLELNVEATYLLGKSVDRVDVLIDNSKDEIYIIPNNENGEYKLHKKKNSNNSSVCLAGLLSQEKNIRTDKRYEIISCERGIMFSFERE